MHLPQVRRKTELLPQSGKPNKMVSKTAADNRRRFINKDVLPMKIDAVAKQNTTHDSELQPEFCSSREACSAGDRQWRHGALTPSWKSPLHLSPSTFQQYHLLICVPHRESPDVSVCSAFPAVW